jgi:hypothetical protein
LDTPTVSTLTAMITAELTQQGALNVVGTDIIPGYAASTAACDPACLNTTAAAANARFVVSGDVGRLGDLFVLTLALFDIDTGTVINRVNLQGMGVGALAPAIPAQLKRLTAVVAPPTPAPSAAPTASTAAAPTMLSSSTTRAPLVTPSQRVR